MVIGEVSAPVEEKLEEQGHGDDPLASNISLDYQPDQDLQVRRTFRETISCLCFLFCKSCTLGWY